MWSFVLSHLILNNYLGRENNGWIRADKQQMVSVDGNNYSLKFRSPARISQDDGQIKGPTDW